MEPTIKSFAINLGPNVVAGFSDRRDGPCNLVGHEYYDGERRANRAAYIQRAFHLQASQTVMPKLKHGTDVFAVSVHNPIWESLPCDAVVTGVTGLALTVTAGDCPTLYLYDDIARVAALVHCGWKSLAGGVIKNTFNVMRTQYNSFAGHVHAFVGPGICASDYEVGWEVERKFGRDSLPDRKYHLNLKEEIRSRLLEEGVQDMEFSRECTFHSGIENGDSADARYFSWRRDRSNPLDCQMALLMMK